MKIRRAPVVVLALAGALLAAPPAGRAVTVEGVTYASTVKEGGAKLELVGAGVRTKWMFDVYTLGVYTESGSCDPRVIRKRDEVKYLRIVMLRHVSRAKMAEALGEAFARNTPSDASGALKKQIATFLSYVYDCPKGTLMEMVYVPGKGTVLRENGKQHGAVVPGSAFARVLMDIYFSSKTCCGSLKKQILGCCNK